MNFNVGEDYLSKSRLLDVGDYMYSFVNIGSYEEYEDFLDAKRMILEERAFCVSRGYPEAKNVADQIISYVNGLIADYEKSIPQSFWKRLLA